jgi:Animal haem peroxidase
LPEGRYSRLCPCTLGAWPEHDEAQLEILASEMKDSPTKREARAKQTNSITTAPSGYVYFGQFIDHDVTRDNRYLADAKPDVEETCNYRTARLDLDSLYGKYPESVECIYESDRQRLKLGPTLEAPGRDGSPIPSSLNDLPRTSNGTAIVIDPRNDENLIVAQLQVLFAKFHNRALELMKEQPALSPALGANLFEQARRFVTWHYQWIVVNDFLPSIARLAVLDNINQAGSRPRLFLRWYTPSDAPVALPVEFSVAAFRFGHSMVRDRYDLNRHVGGVEASEIIRMTRRGGGITFKLPANYVIEWPKFFGGLPGKMNRAAVIDNFISEMLYDLPKQTEEAFRLQLSLTASDFFPGPKMIPPLPEMTLKRGSRIRLPSGEEFATRFRFDVIGPTEIFPKQDEFFGCGLNGRTPLWYYLLREAVVEDNPEPVMAPINRQRQKLGSLGSRIVAETLYQLLKADSQSIANAGRRWEPPVFTARPAGQRWCLRSMANLTRFIEAEAY